MGSHKNEDVRRRGERLRGRGAAARKRGGVQGTPTRSSPKEEASEVEGGSDGWGVAAKKGENEEEKGVNAKTEKEAVVIDQKPHEG